MPTRRHERRRETFVTGNLVVAIGRELLSRNISKQRLERLFDSERIKEKER